MSSYNRVTLMGNLANSPELKYLPGGDTAVVETAIAVNERFKKGEEYVETVSFVDAVFYGRSAEIVNQYLRKGSPILIEGRLKQDRWEKEGQKRSKLRVIVEQMKMIGGKKTGDDDAADQPTPDDHELVGNVAGSEAATY